MDSAPRREGDEVIVAGGVALGALAVEMPDLRQPRPPKRAVTKSA